mmetsp:Transcript_23971/g.45107  ORF Transcript_23971/g.45107 Transcript_23971/m.45107 type:complete len:277 (+) Transcript_23971:353-1183(+)
MWVRTWTVVVFFLRSLWSSSLRSSIFSLRVWFSIFSCSKSIRWRPSASCSLARKLFSSFFTVIFKFMFFSRTRSASSSFLISACSNWAMTFLGMGLPVLLFSEWRLISLLKSRKAWLISLALHSFSSSLVWRSMAILSYSDFWLFSFSSPRTMAVRVSLYCFSISWAAMFSLSFLSVFSLLFWLARCAASFFCSSECSLVNKLRSLSRLSMLCCKPLSICCSAFSWASSSSRSACSASLMARSSSKSSISSLVRSVSRLISSTDFSSLIMLPSSAS